MAKMEVKGFAKPEETRKFDKGKVDLVKIGGAVVGRAEFFRDACVLFIKTL